MQAGRLRERVTIQNPVTSRDPSGQVIESWTDGATIRAEVRGISGRELFTAGAETAEATIRLWVRYRQDITAASRVAVLSGPFKDVVLNVIGRPIPDAKRTMLEILCKEGVEK